MANGHKNPFRKILKIVGLKKQRVPKMLSEIKDPDAQERLKAQLVRSMSVVDRPFKVTRLVRPESVEAFRAAFTTELNESGSAVSTFFNFETCAFTYEGAGLDLNDLPYGWVNLSMVVGQMFTERPDDEYLCMETIWMGNSSQGQGILNVVIDFMESYAQMTNLKGVVVFHIQNVGIAKFLWKRGYCIGREQDYKHPVCDDREVIEFLKGFDPRRNLPRGNLPVRNYIAASVSSFAHITGVFTASKDLR